MSQRIYEPIPGGDFDMIHLHAIHHYLFQDVYDWAGELRTVEIAKDETQFQPMRFIEMGIADVHGRLSEQGFLIDLSKADFAEGAGRISKRPPNPLLYGG